MRLSAEFYAFLRNPIATLMRENRCKGSNETPNAMTSDMAYGVCGECGHLFRVTRQGKIHAHKGSVKSPRWYGG